MQRVISPTRIATLLGSQFDDGSGPAYHRLSRGLSAAIADGRIDAGSRLPSERELTDAVGLSRTTVTRAYADLRERGYLVTRRGSGSIVRLPDVPGGRVDHLLTTDGAADPDMIDLGPTAVSGSSALLDAYAHAVGELEGYLAGHGYFPSGLPALRERLARWHAGRGLPTDPEQILVTGGALTAISIALRSLVGPGDRVVLESPTYPNAIGALEGTPARVVAHPVQHDEPGNEWDPDGFAALLGQVAPRAAYLVPDFHNPTGAVMDAAQRERIGAALRRARVVPVIDESLANLSLDGALPESLAVHVPSAIVVGGLSKTFWGGLRIGWLRAPDAGADGGERMAELVRTRLRSDLGASVVDQLAAAYLLEHGGPIAAEHRAALRAGRDRLLDVLAEYLPMWRVGRPAGGLAVWCELPEARATALGAVAMRHGLRLAPGPMFAPTGGLDRWLRVPFTAPLEQLDRVGPRLAAAWAEACALPEQTGRGRATQPLIA